MSSESQDAPSPQPATPDSLKPLYRNQYVCDVQDQSNAKTYGVVILMFILAGAVIYLALNLCKPLFKKEQ